MISGAERGREEAILIDQGGQYTEIDPFMVSIAVDVLFRLQKPSQSKQRKELLCMHCSNSEMTTAFPRWEARQDKDAHEQRCPNFIAAHTTTWPAHPPEATRLLQSTPER